MCCCKIPYVIVLLLLFLLYFRDGAYQVLEELSSDTLSNAWLSILNTQYPDAATRKHTRTRNLHSKHSSRGRTQATSHKDHSNAHTRGHKTQRTHTHTHTNTNRNDIDNSTTSKFPKTHSNMDTWVPSYGPAGLSYPHLYGRHKKTPVASVSSHPQSGLFGGYAERSGPGTINALGGSLNSPFDNLDTSINNNNNIHNHNNNAGDSGVHMWPEGVAGGGGGDTLAVRVGTSLYPSLPSVTYYTPTVARQKPQHGVHFQMVR